MWKREIRDGQQTKVPYQAHRRPFERAAVDNPKTWNPFLVVSYDCVADGKADGIGVVITEADPMVGLDLDGCVDPVTQTKLTEEAQADRSADQLVYRNHPEWNGAAHFR